MYFSSESCVFNDIFTEFFWSKLVGTFLAITSSFLILMKVLNWRFPNSISNRLSLQLNFQEDPGVYFVAFFGLIMLFFQFGTICFFGQRLTSQSASLLVSSYECNWDVQSKRFKSMLMILRILSIRKIRVGVGQFDFSFKTFYEVKFSFLNFAAFLLIHTSTDCASLLQLL